MSELKPRFEITVSLDGDDNPEYSTWFVKHWLQDRLHTLIESSVILDYQLEVRVEIKAEVERHA